MTSLALSRRAAAWTLVLVLVLAVAVPLSLPDGNNNTAAGNLRRLAELRSVIPHQAARSSDGKSHMQTSADPALLLPALWSLPALRVERRAEPSAFSSPASVSAAVVRPRAPPHSSFVYA